MTNEPKRRRPKTLKNSKYSLIVRQRVRYALANYRFRNSLSYESLFEEILEALDYEDAFKDRQSVKEFLQGSEPYDVKIEATILFLEKKDPLIAGTIEESDLKQLNGDIFSHLITAPLKDDDYIDLVDKLSPYAGIFQHIHIQERGRHPDNTGLIHISTVPSAPYLSVNMLEIDWRSHPKTTDDLDKLSASMTPLNLYNLVLDTGQPYYIGIEEPVRDFCDHIRSATDEGSEPEIPFSYTHRGFIFPTHNNRFFLVQSSISTLIAGIGVGHFEHHSRLSYSLIDLSYGFEERDSEAGDSKLREANPVVFERIKEELEQTILNYLAINSQKMI